MRKNTYSALAILCAYILTLAKIHGQYEFFSPKGSFAIEVSLPSTKLKRLPIYRNAITSLSVVDNYIVGGTSADKGLTPYLFTASIVDKRMTFIYDLNLLIRDQNAILSGFCKNKKQELFAGTMPLESNSNITSDGHLISIKVGAKGDLNVVDLGVPVQGEGIFGLTLDLKKEVLYGISFPSGKFFSFDIATGKTEVYENLMPNKEDMERFQQFALGPENYLPKALIVSKEGHVYGSAPVNKIFYFDPNSRTFHILKEEIPDVWGRRALGQIESWAMDDTGILYGGNAADGQLIKIDPSTGNMVNLGKPIMMNHIKGLAFAADGQLYGIAGGAPGYSHLFGYDTKEGFKDYGNPQFDMIAPGIEQGIAWRGFQLGTLVASRDGKYIVMGETESLSQLLVFPIDLKK